MTQFSLPNAYVKMAMQVLQLATNESDLVAWWMIEKPNRERFELNPKDIPGKLLNEAFRSHLAHLRAEAICESQQHSQATT